MHHIHLHSALQALKSASSPDSRPLPTNLVSRRLFLGAIGSAALASTARLSPAAAFATTNSTDGEELDEALDLLAPYGPSFRGGLSNHGPMTVEALMSLGRGDAVVNWASRYRRRLEKTSGKPTLIAAEHWQDALGKSARTHDWHAWFTNELAEAPWRDVVATWVPRLAPGMAAAGLHGVIRAGHAVCGLAKKETPQRLDELARALGYWAAEYLPLPGEHKKSGSLAPAQALQQVEPLPKDMRRTRGLITSELSDIQDYKKFPKVIDLVDTQKGAPNFLAELLTTFAGTFVHTRRSSFEFLHAVTGTGAVTELLAFVKPEQHERVLAYTWQVTAAVYTRYGTDGILAAYEPGDNKPDAKQVVKRAVASGDEHTIKLVAACERERRRNPDPRLLAAAAKRVGR